MESKCRATPAQGVRLEPNILKIKDLQRSIEGDEIDSRPHVQKQIAYRQAFHERRQESDILRVVNCDGFRSPTPHKALNLGSDDRRQPITGDRSGAAG